MKEHSVLRDMYYTSMAILSCRVIFIVAVSLELNMIRINEVYE
jgi:hypothetical protein